jgi:hypothetical protein
LEIHPDLIVLVRVFAVAFAVGLDVLAISIGVGVARLAYDASLRVGLAFASSEIAMQIIGYGLGAGASHLLGEIATDAGFVLLASIGLLMIRKSCRHSSEEKFDASRGAGLIMASLSISLDSLGVGIALPALRYRCYLFWSPFRSRRRSSHCSGCHLAPALANGMSGTLNAQQGSCLWSWLFYSQSSAWLRHGRQGTCADAIPPTWDRPMALRTRNTLNREVFTHAMETEPLNSIVMDSCQIRQNRTGCRSP